MTLEASVLRDSALLATEVGFDLDIHLAWYRSLPLSCVENIEVVIDGREIPRDDMQLRVDGRHYRLDDLPTHSDAWWFVQDAATVVVSDSDAPRAGERATVQVQLDTRIPYIVIGPDTALVQRTHVEREVTAR